MPGVWHQLNGYRAKNDEPRLLCTVDLIRYYAPNVKEKDRVKPAYRILDLAAFQRAVDLEQDRRGRNRNVSQRPFIIYAGTNAANVDRPEPTKPSEFRRRFPLAVSPREQRAVDPASQDSQRRPSSAEPIDVEDHSDVTGSDLSDVEGNESDNDSNASIDFIDVPIDTNMVKPANAKVTGATKPAIAAKNAGKVKTANATPPASMAKTLEAHGERIDTIAALLEGLREAHDELHALMVSDDTDDFNQVSANVAKFIDAIDTENKAMKASMPKPTVNLTPGRMGPNAFLERKRTASAANLDNPFVATPSKKVATAMNVDNAQTPATPGTGQTSNAFMNAIVSDPNAAFKASGYRQLAKALNTTINNQEVFREYQRNIAIVAIDDLVPHAANKMYALLYNTYVVFGPYAFVKALKAFIENHIKTDAAFSSVNPWFVMKVMLKVEFSAVRTAEHLTTDMVKALDTDPKAAHSIIDVDSDKAKAALLIWRREGMDSSAFRAKVADLAASIAVIEDSAIECFPKVTTDTKATYLEVFANDRELANACGVSVADLPRNVVAIEDNDEEEEALDVLTLNKRGTV